MADLMIVKESDSIVRISLNRPEVFNAYHKDLAESFAANLISLAADKQVRAIIISGEGKAFCAGGDLKWALSSSHDPSAALYDLASRFHQAILEIRRMPKPCLAAINGLAAGGGFSLALACDFRIMAKSAVLRQAYTSNGLSIDGGGSFILPRLVGLAKALEIMAFDKPIDSEQALSLGLATKVVEDVDVQKEALNMASDLAKRSMNSFGWSKKLLTDSFDSSFESQLERERWGLTTCTAHPDGIEGLRAFLEKRKPIFK